MVVSRGERERGIGEGEIEWPEGERGRCHMAPSEWGLFLGKKKGGTKRKEKRNEKRNKKKNKWGKIRTHGTPSLDVGISKSYICKITPHISLNFINSILAPNFIFLFHLSTHKFTI